MITQERLKELLHYDPETGVFTWRVDRKGGATLGFTCAKAGTIAGRVSNTGHRHISIDNIRYLAHRLAVLYMTGAWPKAKIDHRDGDADNNRWANIREATHAQNMRNSKTRKHNKLGVKGVRRAPGNRFSARITVNREVIYLGTYDTIEQAKAIYDRAACDLHGEFARLA